nr:OmpA family protein [Pseudomarimonas arenosa]
MALAEIPFARGEIDLSSDTGALSEVARYLSRHPELEIKVVGHADSIGDPQRNHLLSEQRAEAVKSFLMKRGVQGSRVHVEALGSHAPVGDNRSDYGREQNRRVEIFVMNLSTHLPSQ